MAGNSIGSAPASRRARDSVLAWARVRVTSTCLPNSGRSSYQRRRSRSAATCPTTITVGGTSAAASAAAASSASGAATVRCRGVAPHSIAAAGVAGSRPSAMSRAAIPASARRPIRKTSVSTPVASAAQSIREAGLPGASCPVTTAKEEAASRWVMGMPA